MTIRIMLFFVGLFFSISVYAENSQQVVNNYGGQAPQTSPCPPANQNNIYDPRVPPAGTYKVQNGDGSSNMVYTTGEKKPYITDNNCNNNSVGPITPYVSGGFPPRPPHK